MRPKFWHDRWDNQQIGFHQSSFNTHLETYWNQLNLAENSTVFVPLCGKSLDLIFLAQQNHKVIGCELVQSAVEDFFNENQFEYEIINTHSELKLYRTLDQSISIYQGDLFKLDLSSLNIDAIYDRASLVAFPEDMRVNYISHIKQHLKQFKQLLITLEYPKGSIEGPPFSVPEDEVRCHYVDCQIELLYRQAPPPNQYSFQATQSIQATDQVYLIQL